MWVATGQRRAELGDEAGCNRWHSVWATRTEAVSNPLFNVDRTGPLVGEVCEPVAFVEGNSFCVQSGTDRHPA